MQESLSETIMRTLLSSRPENDAPVAQRLRAMGITGTDGQLSTNANLLGLTLMDRGLAGDIRAIKMAFEMACPPSRARVAETDDVPVLIVEDGA